ncbi:NAD(P)/FAD-dependent oxidoreductase [Methylobacterium sp. NEAU K]|uniref:NAD(P)/FAD-dependent oxidoreductase n=1 Tax=Methylobacterium sp. NEAU K TaxID=3064946 RepID=UPI0027330AAB|nr:NAD(P)-binding protein [Methylobacterium sp. NEAU K]MDP4002294.1 NAD(P)-binding protein [Methylobacterium sp. NEAU K]
MNERPSVAILGAGMAGATVARRIAEAGWHVRVFDKGRGVGGRMSTRHTHAMQFDHGAQFMRARGETFAARLAGWDRRGIVASWAGAGRRVGVPGMTAPVRDLLGDLPVASGTTIVRIGRDRAGWRLTDSAGANQGPFAALAIAIPAPQAAALLDASGLALPGVEQAAYAPCWSLMLAVENAPGDVLIEPQEGPVGLIALDSSKPGRPAGARLTLHATRSWSRAHLEAPCEAIVDALTRAAGECLGAPLRPAYAEAHRWRYAQVETALGRPCLYDPGLRLGAAGDWCLGPRIEAAHDSGLALAEAILADLSASA